jgi:hypothetical protein
VDACFRIDKAHHGNTAEAAAAAAAEVDGGGGGGDLLLVRSLSRLYAASGSWGWREFSTCEVCACYLLFNQFRI